MTPDPFDDPPDWFTAPWPLPEPLPELRDQRDQDDRAYMFADEYQREAIDTAKSEEAQEAARQEFKK